MFSRPNAVGGGFARKNASVITNEASAAPACPRSRPRRRSICTCPVSLPALSRTTVLYRSRQTPPELRAPLCTPSVLVVCPRKRSWTSEGIRPTCSMSPTLPSWTVSVQWLLVYRVYPYHSRPYTDCRTSLAAVSILWWTA